MEGGAAYHLPTIRQRVWRFVGFRYHLGHEPEDTDGLDGWAFTTIRLNFSWMDRLRLFLTGRLVVGSVIYFNAPSPTTCKSRVDWEIKAPGEL